MVVVKGFLLIVAVADEEGLYFVVVVKEGLVDPGDDLGEVVRRGLVVGGDDSGDAFGEDLDDVFLIFALVTGRAPT